ncbi:molybdate ABC transporter substrate-binding protein [soil metagenome]
MKRLILIAIGLLLQATALARAQDLQVAAAISMKESLAQCAADFENESKTHVRFTFGGSGELAAQIAQGAPIDLFISAAQDQIDQLARANVVDGASRVVIARNRMVLIVPVSAKNPPASFNDLQDGAKTKTIAIGQPRTVPAGKYASQILAHFRMSTQRLIYGTNVRQVLGYVERGEVSAGLVYHTDAMLAGDKVKVVANAEESMHDPIVYPAILIRGSANAAAAAEFLTFLRSEPAQKVLIGNGFVPSTQPSK